MKTYGQIDFEARTKHAEKLFERLDRPEWEEINDLAKGVSEAGAQAVIEEFKRRNNIVTSIATSRLVPVW